MRRSAMARTRRFITASSAGAGSASSTGFSLPYDKALDKQRHKIENLFAKLKDWRRIATRYDRCAHTFFSAICIAATFTFYLNQ